MIEGRTYREVGQPVRIVAQWASYGQKPTADSAGRRVPGAPRNVLIRRVRGELVVRPFRGLRCP
jgi:hypothetical protein